MTAATCVGSTRDTTSGWPGDDKWRYSKDKEGRKFVERMNLRDI